MGYIALKGARFDRKYNKGETVPDNVIAPEMASKLVQCGILQKQAEAGEQARPETKTEAKTEGKQKRKGMIEQPVEKV